MIRLRTAIPVLPVALVLALVPALSARAQTCTFDLECDDGNQCTTDVCTLSSCSHPAMSDGESCGDACTQGATCQGGACTGGVAEPGCIPCENNDDCEDGSDCTVDICDLGRCEREGGEGEACDDEDPCTQDDRCNDGVCAGGPLVCDDGVPCTTDSCDGGTCTYQAENTICAAPTECSAGECRPDDPAANATGCVAQSAEYDGSECTEDNDPCTIDQCRGGGCTHDALEDPQGCAPLRPSYRRAVTLRGGVERVLSYVLDEVDAGGDTGDALVGELEGIRADLETAILALSGRDGGSTPPAGALRGLRLAATATTAQQRGRLALGWLRGTPARVQQFLGTVSRGRRRGELEPDAAGELRRNGRILLPETKALKRDVKNLQRTFSVFQR